MEFFCLIVNKHYKKNKNLKKSTMVLVYQPQILHLALAIKNLRCHFFCFFVYRQKTASLGVFGGRGLAVLPFLSNLKELYRLQKNMAAFFQKAAPFLATGCMW